MNSRSNSEQLVEFEHVHQNEPDSHRRWFSDSSYELILWYDLEDRLTGFQICYGAEHEERAITWTDGYFSHRSVIDEVHSHATPILNGTVIHDDKRLKSDFLEHARSLETNTLGYIRDVLDRNL